MAPVGMLEGRRLPLRQQDGDTLRQTAPLEMLDGSGSFAEDEVAGGSLWGLLGGRWLFLDLRDDEAADGSSADCGTPLGKARWRRLAADGSFGDAGRQWLLCGG